MLVMPENEGNLPFLKIIIKKYSDSQFLMVEQELQEVRCRSWLFVIVGKPIKLLIRKKGENIFLKFKAEYLLPK